MPAKNSSLKNGPRHNIVDKAFHRRFCKETGLNVPYSTFVNVINTSSKAIQRILITNSQGFKFPETLGYGCVTRYTPKTGTRSIDWVRTKEANTLVYHTNFHSYGYKPRYGWYTDNLAKCRNINIYKFVPERAYVRAVVAEMKKGKIYNEYNYEHFKAKAIKIGKITK